ncbi:MAG TPA: FKBP-type peptidyl-prolyl cis-trans isomerase [Geobacteraceae bacterium]|nr:FKBP-type peptidyl-prolyl cis-trans isomerase [Geobacteraceae bacterium]
MLKRISAAIVIMVALTACASLQPETGVVKTATKPLTEDQKSIYAVGLVLARQIATFALTDYELELVKMGLTDGLRGRKPLVDFATYSKKSQELGIERRDAHGRWLEERVDAFMEAESFKPGTFQTSSGVLYRPITVGTGPSPLDTNTVKVHYISTLIDGWEMESTYKNGEPDEVLVSDFMKCLKEGVKLMKQGGSARIICPPETALGNKADGIIPPNATLVFTIELLEVK